MTNIAPSYDATVLDPGGAAVSIYRGLSRRNLLLPHKHFDALESASNKVTVTGDLSGGGQYPLGSTDAVAVYVFSDPADGQAFLGGGAPAPFDGPGYGPISLSWSGSDSISGQIVALGTFAIPGDAGVSAWFAHQPIVLANARAAFVNLALIQVAENHIAGTIDTPPGHWVVQQQAFYRMRIVHAIIGVVNQQSSAGSFDHVVPDLTVLPADLCIEDVASPGSVMTQRCGLALGQTDVSVTLQSAPLLVTPADGAPFTSDTQFSWSPFAGGVHLLELETAAPSRTNPNVYLFTSDATATRPDLRALGVPFGAGVTYQCTVAGLGPYVGVDDAFGPQGIGAPFPSEIRRAYSPSVTLMTNQ
jgi:hypothetical protein